jgi:uncharacterized pyridoxamine 5'-phosphate oxidase family protein
MNRFCGMYRYWRGNEYSRGVATEISLDASVQSSLTQRGVVVQDDFYFVVSRNSRPLWQQIKKYPSTPNLSRSIKRGARKS